jgi:hypothetical protein
MYNGEVNIKFREIFEEVIAARTKNVIIKKPDVDTNMPKAYS